MLAALMDELEKIAGNAALPGFADSAIGKPASISEGSKVTTTLKPQTKPTNYSVVHNQSPMAATGTADASKSAPPPPVRA